MSKLIDEAGNTASFDNVTMGYGFNTAIRNQTLNDLEGSNPAQGWTHDAGSVGEDDWAIVSNASLAHSGSHLWRTESSDSPKDVWLIMPPMDLPADAELRFWHRYDLEAGFDGRCWKSPPMAGRTGATWATKSPPAVTPSLSIRIMAARWPTGPRGAAATASI